MDAVPVLAHLRVRDLKDLAAGKTAQEFAASVGPFVLIQRPPEPILAQMAMRYSASNTLSMVGRKSMAHEIIAMIKNFDDMIVAGFGPRDGSDVLDIGRSLESRLVVHEPSVSQNHATLRWDRDRNAAFVRDVGSTNGTFVNVTQIGQGEVEVHDGDVVCFGDAKFIFALSIGLHAQVLAASRMPNR